MTIFEELHDFVNEKNVHLKQYSLHHHSGLIYTHFVKQNRHQRVSDNPPPPTRKICVFYRWTISGIVCRKCM